ncbi:MAG TPA: SAM-dependent chlorinase/fluorinase [Solirubrobacteraceae bacterium]|nr:SAM-dependent chlorinase/fluorinase [Solirubrobacteraceae bacterium]
MGVPVLTFLSDYGTADEFVGVCHGVIARLSPEVRIIDITHGIERHDVRLGALALRAALPYMPAGVHLAVVDPEVGAERRAVAVRVAEEDRLLVGPDNGLLSLAAERLGGVVEAVDVSRSPHRLEPVSATFHGRDIFAPVAARLAAGAPLGAAGDPLSADELVVLELPRPREEDGALVVHALHADRFGNLALDVGHDALVDHGLKLGDGIELEVGGRRLRARYARTFADVPPGELLLYEDAQQTLALAVNRGSATERLGLRRDGELRLRRR